MRQASVEGRLGMLVDVSETNLFVARRESILLARVVGEIGKSKYEKRRRACNMEMVADWKEEEMIIERGWMEKDRPVSRGGQR